nr:hypothetical protein [Tanacetum cinerariifolium]
MEILPMSSSNNITVAEETSEEIEDDNLRDKLLNVNLLIATIEALNDNPTQSSEPLTKSSSTSLNSFLEETNTVMPIFVKKTLCHNLGVSSKHS